MSSVGIREGIRYGFSLLWYILGVWIVGGALAFAGAGMAASAADGSVSNVGPIVFGAILALAGAVVLYAGSLGLLYKIIADGVKRGNEGARTEAGIHTARGRRPRR